MVEMFSFKDALHDHITIGFVDGCIACAQVQADMALSTRAYRLDGAKAESGAGQVSGVSRNLINAA